MIVIVKKNRVIMVTLFFLVSIALFSINLIRDEAAPATNGLSTQKTILIDPGHGGEDPGAVSDYSGIKEKDINLNIALKVKEILQKQDFKVLMSREEDKLEYNPDTRNILQKRKEDLTRRKKMMDEAGASIVVSIHLNKFPQTKYYGSQTFYPPKSPDSQKLASCIQKSLKANVDSTNTREALEKKEPIIILKDYKTTTAIVECGFLSNPDEEKKLGTVEYQEKLADAICEGIKNYFK
jgi:N-acetylmuramoyl-L-alanine amidase